MNQYVNTNSNVTFNTITETSALKYKTAITPISESIQGLRGMQGVYFTRISDNSRQIGFIADEIAKIYPELVLMKDGEVEGLHYQRITALLVEAIKELDDRIKKLEAN
jgi:hypothetical protein